MSKINRHIVLVGILLSGIMFVRHGICAMAPQPQKTCADYLGQILDADAQNILSNIWIGMTLDELRKARPNLIESEQYYYDSAKKAQFYDSDTTKQVKSFAYYLFDGRLVRVEVIVDTGIEDYATHVKNTIIAISRLFGKPSTISYRTIESYKNQVFDGVGEWGIGSAVQMHYEFNTNLAMGRPVAGIPERRISILNVVGDEAISQSMMGPGMEASVIPEEIRSSAESMFRWQKK